MPDATPVIYATLEAPALVNASITFECDLDCMGDTLDVTFKAAADVKVNGKSKIEHACPQSVGLFFHLELFLTMLEMITNDIADNQGHFDHRTGSIYEEILQKKRWELSLPRLEGQPRVIPKGK